MYKDRTIEVLVENVDWKRDGYFVESYVTLPMPATELSAWKRSVLQADHTHGGVLVSEILPVGLGTSLGLGTTADPIEVINAAMWILSSLSERRLRATVAASARLDSWLELASVALRSGQVRFEEWPPDVAVSGGMPREALARQLFSHDLYGALDACDGADEAFDDLLSFVDPLSLGHVLADGGASARVVAGLTGFVERPQADGAGWPDLDRLDCEGIRELADEMTLRATREGGMLWDGDAATDRLTRVAPEARDAAERPHLLEDVRRLVMALDERQCERVTLAVRALGEIDTLQLANLVARADEIPFVPYDRVPEDPSDRDGALRALGATQVRMLRDRAREGLLPPEDEMLGLAMGCADTMSYAEDATCGWRCSEAGYVSSIPSGIECGLEACQVIEEGLVAEAKAACDRRVGRVTPLSEQREDVIGAGQGERAEPSRLAERDESIRGLS